VEADVVSVAAGAAAEAEAPGLIFFGGFRGLNFPFCDGGGAIVQAFLVVVLLQVNKMK
jgi:hypothetical protein